MEKIMRSYVWRGRKEASGGHCMIAWPKVARAIELGGLGIADLKSLGWALRVRWAWLKKTEPGKPRASFTLHMNKCVEALFSMAVTSEVGDGRNTLFWKDRWLLGQRIEDLAPLIFGMVPKRIANKRTVAEVLQNIRWTRDIHGEATVPVIGQVLQLCNLLSGMQLQIGVQDAHIWRLSASGKYTAKSAYVALFQGSTCFEPWERIWKSWRQANVNFSFGWLHTTDVGQRTGLQGGTCHIRIYVCCVIRRRKRLIICSPRVCSLDSFGSPSYSSSVLVRLRRSHQTSIL